MARKKSTLMTRVEEKCGEPLETLLPRLYNRGGLPHMVKVTGISKGTLWYWMMRFNCAPRRVAVGPHERLEIVPRGQVRRD